MASRSPGGGGGRTDAPRHPQLWEWVATQIRSAILQGQFLPGTKLVESELADRYGTSRGPVREALRELAYAGLVVELPRRGTLVSTLDTRDLTEVFAVREALESFVCAHAVRRATASELNALERRLDALDASADYLEAAVHDLAFHRAFVGLAGNGRMDAVYDQMLAQTMLLLSSVAAGSPALRRELPPAAHRDILIALRDGDATATRAAVQAHYRHAAARLFVKVVPRGGDGEV